MLISTKRRFNRARMLRLLDEMEGVGGTATSLYVPHDLPASEVEKTLKAPLGEGIEEALPDIAEAVESSRTGSVIFWGEQARYMVVPPFPITERLFASGYDVEPLRAMLQQERTVALILVRLNAYAVGVFRGERLVSSKVGTGLVHSRHRQGGSSVH